MKLVYNVSDRLPLKKNLVYALQQLLAIMAAILPLPILVDSPGIYMSQLAELCTTGFGALFYIFIASK